MIISGLAVVQKSSTGFPPAQMRIAGVEGWRSQEEVLPVIL
jgi:hypothetical protein